MAIVTALQFSPSSGAMICDEEYWFLRRRRSFFLDNIRNLMTDDISDNLHLEAAYGGWGHPGFHEEVIKRARESIKAAYKNYTADAKEHPLHDLEAIAMIVRDAIQATRRRRVDDMLKYLYGFTTDEVNQGAWDENGTHYEIKQETVLSEAKRIIQYERKDALTESIFKNKAIIIGYDRHFGYRAFHLNAENTVCSLISGGFEAIGAGLYGAGVEFSKTMNRLTLDQRRNGFDRIHGVVTLFEATMTAYETFHEVGGGLNLIYINGEEKTHAKRYMELCDAPTRLVFEMIRAKQYGLVTLEAIYPLIDDIVFKGVPRKLVEEKFIASACDQQLLNKLMRGYKISPFLSIGQTSGHEAKIATEPSVKKGGKKQ